MKNKHLNFDEVVALFEKRFELLPETMEHISSCDECSGLIFEFQEMTSIIKSNSHIKHIPDAQKIEMIALESFALLHKEAETSEKGSILNDIISFLNNWMKPIAIAGATAAVAIVLFNSFDNKNDNTGKIADNNKTNVKENVQETKPAENLFSEKGVKKAGLVFKSSIATIKTIEPTYFDTVSENEIVMKNGKAKFDVVPGNDFRINVNNSFIVRVLGTSFVVDYSKDDFSVKVFEGLVEVIDKSDNSTISLTKDMEKTYKIMKSANSKLARIKKLSPVKKLRTTKMNITPDASFLTQGREALKAGKNGVAVQLFIMELEKGNSKDKALFETVKIYEALGKHSDTVSILKSNRTVIKSSKIYKEELLINGCMAQYKNKSSKLSFCNEYLKNFPHGYRKEEIEAIVNE